VRKRKLAKKYFAQVSKNKLETGSGGSYQHGGCMRMPGDSEREVNELEAVTFELKGRGEGDAARFCGERPRK